MTDDPNNPDRPRLGDLDSPFLFVPQGAPEPAEWMRRHPGWVRFPATLVPHAPVAQRTVPGTGQPWPLDKRGQPWPKSRFGQPLRPLDEYPPGVRAPGEGYTGPIADPARAVQSYREFMAAGGMGTYDPDPHAPSKAYLRDQNSWRNSGKYAGASPRSPASMAQAHVEGAVRAVQGAADSPRTLSDATGLPGLDKQDSDGTPLPDPFDAAPTRPIVPIRPSGDPIVDALRTALAPAQGTTYGNVLPFAMHDATGELRPAMPNAVRDLANGMVDLIDGPRTGTVTPRATGVLAAGMMGGLGRSAATGGTKLGPDRLLSAPGAPGKGAGRTPQPIHGATRTVPLGFEQEAQFLAAVQELQTALKASGIHDAAVGVRGSAVTGHSPAKGTVFHAGSDVDFYIESGQLASGYKPSRSTPGLVHPDKIMRDYPLLQEWAAKWAGILGRDVTPGAFAPGTLPKQPAIEVK